MEPAKAIENGTGKRKQIAIVEKSQPPATPEAAFLQTIERLAPVIGIDGVREMMKMRREEQVHQAEREFNVDMSLAQAELIPVAKNQKNKQTGSDYANLAAIAEEAMPIIYRNGFGVITSEFESKKPDHLGVACEVTHRGGHSKRYEFNIPIDGTGMKGNTNKTATHAYGSTLSYGERYAKCKVFGIATKDDDGNAAGAAKPAERITEKQLKELSDLFAKTDAPAESAQIAIQFFKIEQLADMTPAQHAKTVAQLKTKLGIE